MTPGRMKPMARRMNCRSSPPHRACPSPDRDNIFCIMDHIPNDNIFCIVVDCPNDNFFCITDYPLQIKALKIGGLQIIA